MVSRDNIDIKIKLIETDSDFILPEYQTEGAAGIDLRANINTTINSLNILPGKWEKVKTGIAVAIPKGFEGQIRPRSGIAYKNGVTVLNSPGTIDSDYRGEIMVILINHSANNYELKHGERIAQLVISPVIRASFTLLESLDSTLRNEKGFGSTGNK
ncbi:MAG: dUTP diphosphatase [Alphaproteobacteria bacterium]|jgi:dUTP pyrophosphatase|tara:strand:- start:48348 stop:48818 length:471 start_codon:yes stop_codon:yes gene_type:complete